MNKTWEMALGDPQKFLDELTLNGARFSSMMRVEHYDLQVIRNFVESRKHEIANDPEVFRAVVAAFGIVLIDYYAQKLRVRGLFKKRIRVESKRFGCELLDLFYRCVFEGLDLAPEGEALAKPA
jgi:hypothetical protein